MFDEGALLFDEATHSYRLGSRPLFSVTQCLAAVGIIDHSQIPANVLKVAAERGTLVHRILHYEMTGGVDETTIDQRLRPYVEAARMFREESGFMPTRVECRIYDDLYGYAGTFDAMGTIRGGHEVIVDWKTGALLPGHRIQMAAYASATGEPFRYRRLLVQLKANGTYRLVEAPLTSYRNDFSVFASACVLAQWRAGSVSETTRESSYWKEQ